MEKYRPGSIYVSGMTRALQTAAPITEELNKISSGKVPISLGVDLHEEGGIFQGPRRNRQDESNYDIVHGLTFAEMQEIVPTLECQEGREFGNSGWWKGGVEKPAGTAERSEKTKVRCCLRHYSI